MSAVNNEQFCSPDNIRDYFFGELDAAGKKATERHLASGCPVCGDELASLSGIRSALRSIPEEEPPRRIAFVADKVFEPRWWQKLFAGSGQLAFAASAMLAVAIVLHGYLMRPVAAPSASPQTLAANAAKTDVATSAQMEAEIERRVKFEVARAVAASEGQQMERVLEVVNAKLRHASGPSSQELAMIRDYVERMEKRNAVVARRAMYE